MGVVFEEAGFNGSLSGLSRHRSAHVDPGVTCSAVTSERRQMDNTNKTTNGVMLERTMGRLEKGLGKRTTTLTTSPAWQTGKKVFRTDPCPCIVRVQFLAATNISINERIRRAAGWVRS